MIVTIDLENYEVDLKTNGDGSCRKDGSKILVAGVYDGSKYTPCYPNTESWNYLADILKDKRIKKVLHNAIYDMSWLYCGYDLVFSGEIHDTMTRMVYIDEYANLDLDSCCKYFNVAGKNKADTIEAWWEQNKHLLGYTKKTDTMWKHVLEAWETSAEFRNKMIEYNKQDCIATFDLYFAQEAKLKNVYDAYMVDVRLMPLIIKMKKSGVRIDTRAMDKLTCQVQNDIERVSKQLETMYGITPDIIASPKKFGACMNKMGIHSPIKSVKTGAESWSADARARINHPVIPLVEEFKNYSAILSKYLEGSLANALLPSGRIHCTFSPNKREDGGTVTGRFACSHPNLQNIPKRGKSFGTSYGQAMRSLFIPEEGCMMCSADYSQIEYLLLGHFAIGQQAEWFRGQALSGVDFHTVAMAATGIPSRPVVKTFNYGVIYGMGWYTAMMKNYMLFQKLAAEKGLDIETFTKQIYNEYHQKLPVIRDTMQYVQNVAKLQGYVKTIGGRYQHKPKPIWDPVTGKINDYLYKMLNKLIQGSAADILKFALLDCYEAGLFDVLTMHITVHDENVVSMPYNKEGFEAAHEMQQRMNNSFKEQLTVPMSAVADAGPTWGYWEEDIWKDMSNGIFNRQKDCWWYKE